MELTCGMCGRRFAEDRGQAACRSCPLSPRSCRYVRCPDCGYENPATPGWLRRLAGRWGGGTGSAGQETRDGEPAATAGGGSRTGDPSC